MDTGDWVVAADGVLATRGRLAAHGRGLACALGRAGIRAVKREGDGGTPAGTFALRRVLWRPDRGPRPVTTLPVAEIGPDDGWCDESGHPDYNRPVRLPHPASHERLWRADPLYDVVVVVGHNDAPVVPGAGSAIFVHVARDGLAPTEGCVALAADDLRWLLSQSGPGARLQVSLP